MSIFDNLEKQMCDQEKEEAEIIASNEYQKELDEENAITISVGELKEIIKTIVNGKNIDNYVDLINAIKKAKAGKNEERKDN